MSNKVGVVVGYGDCEDTISATLMKEGVDGIKYFTANTLEELNVMVGKFVDDNNLILDDRDKYYLDNGYYEANE